MSFDSLLILDVAVYKNSGSGDGQGGELDAWYNSSNIKGRIYEQGTQKIVQGGNTGLINYSNPVDNVTKVSLTKDASITESDKLVINSGEYNILFIKKCYDQAGLHHYLVDLSYVTNNQVI